MSLDDLMIISDNRIHMSSAHDVDLGETTFTELAANIKLPLNDPKLEKKVTFARLMNKVSAEMSSGSEVDAEIVICQQLLQILTKMRIFYFFFFWISFNHFTLIFLCLWCPGISFEQTNKKKRNRLSFNLPSLSIRPMCSPHTLSVSSISNFRHPSNSFRSLIVVYKCLAIHRVHIR